ncbi:MULTISPECIES: transposase [unclassified Streptomyces]|uniref:transposase n=1 Tax=unclassified Streptomyces TaxID=2593676 RepID=UPI000DD51179|nr:MULTISPECIES: transposase [unclassified Streptomyces]QZZ29336.1 hypothetical protein A7X85_26570 [Streptomyces sp. ST1015]
MLVVGDGVTGPQRLLAEVFPQTRHQGCGVHEKERLERVAEVRAARRDRAHAEKAVTAFEKALRGKGPQGSQKITSEVDELLALYDLPAEHCVRLRTTNPIESTFSTMKFQPEVACGAGSPTAALAMVFKLVGSTQARWRTVTAPRLVTLVRADARFENGLLVESTGLANHSPAERENGRDQTVPTLPRVPSRISGLHPSTGTAMVP